MLYRARDPGNKKNEPSNHVDRTHKVIKCIYRNGNIDAKKNKLITDSLQLLWLQSVAHTANGPRFLWCPFSTLLFDASFQFRVTNETNYRHCARLTSLNCSSVLSCILTYSNSRHTGCIRCSLNSGLHSFKCTFFLVSSVFSLPSIHKIYISWKSFSSVAFAPVV